MKKFNNRDRYVCKCWETEKEENIEIERQRERELWECQRKNESEKQKQKPTEKRQSGQCFTDTNASRVWKMISHCGVLCSLMKYNNLLLWIIFAYCCCLLLEKLSVFLASATLVTHFLEFFKNYTVLIK